MFGNNYFGELPFGGSPDFVLSDSERVILSSNFIPEILAEEPLFSELTNLVDYIIHTYHVTEIKNIAGLYDTFHPNFDADTIIEFLGGTGHIVAPLNDSQKRSLILLLSSLYEVKGLRSGIEALMSSFGIPGYIFEEWEVNGEVETGIPSRPDIFPFQIWYEKMESCNIAAVFNVTGKLAIEGLEDQLVQSIEALLWVCARLTRWVWLMDFRGDNSDTSIMSGDTVEFYDYFTFCSKFFREGNVWCFLPKPIIECESTDPINRSLVFFTVDEYDVPYMIEDDYGVPIFLSEDYRPASIEEDGYDGTFFQDEYGNFSLNYWKFRPDLDLDCCEDSQELILFGDDSLYTEFYDLYFSSEYASGLKNLIKTYIDISSVDDLFLIGNDIEYPLDANYRLTNDIDMTGVSWEPLGNIVVGGILSEPVWGLSSLFCGILDGNNYSITNLEVTGTKYVGFFSALGSGSIIKNLTITTSETGVTGTFYVGILAGYSLGSAIKNCNFEGVVNFSNTGGGMIGYATNSNIEYISTRVNVAKVTGVTNGNSAGGILGNLTNSTMKKCIANGTVTGRNSSGGLLGSVSFSNVSLCASYTESVSGNDYVGGFTGRSGHGAYIENCLSLSSVEGVNFVGGFTGVNIKEVLGSPAPDAEIVNCFSVGLVTGSTNLGGFCGDNQTTAIITNCYWNTVTSGQLTSDGGTGLTTAEMKDFLNYVDWDFFGVWKIEQGFSYPKIIGILEEDIPDDYILISSLDDLILIGNDINYPLDGKYYLDSDLDISASSELNGGTGIIPVGYDLAHAFEGVFDGCGYEIHGLYINRTGSDYQGLFGVNTGNIRRLSVSGEITVIGSHSGIGGISGGNTGVISECFSYVNVNAEDSDSVGGICGASSGILIQRSKSEGNFIYGNVKVGGLVGSSTATIILTSFSNSTVQGDSEVGGLLGDTEIGSVVFCYSCGEVTGNTSVGGLIGDNYDDDPSPITYCFWDTESSGQNTSDGGDGKTTLEMKTKDTYTSWPFSNVFDIIEDSTYPYFRDFQWSDTIIPIIEISTREDLEKIGNAYTHPLDGYYILTSNIDLSDSNFTPIGEPSPIPITSDYILNGDYFTGVFDGNGYKIYGLSIDEPVNNVGIGLFTTVGRGGIIVNLDITTNKSNGTPGEVTGASYCGVICGILYKASIINCTARGSLTVTTQIGGGIVGYVDGGNVSLCRSFVSVYDGNGIGGLIGAMAIIYSGRYSSVSLSLSSTNYVSSSEGDYVGGLIGYLYGTTSSDYSISNCFSSSYVEGGDNTGGLIGSSTGYTIENCFSYGEVVGAATVGGLCASSTSTTFNNCFWDTEASGQETSDGGTGKTTEEMMDRSTFEDAGWDFTDIWRISDGTSYPDLFFNIRDTLFYRTGTISWLEKDGSIYVFGGDSYGRLFSDVWKSAHGGKFWVEALSYSDWSVRKNLSSFIYNDRVFLFGGVLDETVLNDMWEMLEDEYGNISFVKIFDENTVESIDLTELQLGNYRAIVYEGYVYFMGSTEESTIYRMQLDEEDNPIFESVVIPERFGFSTLSEFIYSATFIYNNRLYLINELGTNTNVIFFDGTSWDKTAKGTISSSQLSGASYINSVAFDEYVCVVTNTGVYVSKDCNSWFRRTSFIDNSVDSPFGTCLFAGPLDNHLYLIDNVGVYHRGLYLNSVDNSYTWDHSYIESEIISISGLDEECYFVIPTGYENGTQVKILGVGTESNVELETIFYMSIVPEEYLEYYEYGEYVETMKIGLSLTYNDAINYNTISKTQLIEEVGEEYNNIILTWTELYPSDREDLS